MTTDAKFIERALELAARALYDTDPNPAVGCVIVAHGTIVGEGWTQPAGGDHAEIGALRTAGPRAAGATVYVTLEPCCHVGRTGPCTDALIDAGVARVVYCVDDPNPQVGGRGARRLRDAGIEVRAGIETDRARSINHGFFSRMERGRPFVRLKIAASLDGRTALQNGESQWITDAPARADVHRWRARSSVVLSGIGTVLADDPQLNARPAGLERSFVPPVRAIVDSNLRIPASARVFDDGAPLLVFTCSQSDRRGQLPEHAEVIEVAADETGRCDLGDVMGRLGRRGVNDVWVESGPTLGGALLEGGWVDELFIYTAPVVLGDDARGMFGPLGLTRMSDRREFEILSTAQIGRDLRLVLRPGTLAHRRADGY